MDTAVRTDDRAPTVDRETIGLGAIDVGLVATLLVIGQLSHGTNPIDDPIPTLETIAPFVIGWLLVAVLVGFYTRRLTSVTRAARVTSVTWLAAANVGLLLRQSVFGETAAWPFPLVITGFGFLLLVGWRVGYAALSDRLR
ncbi:DUF3054 domain-containing protein [Haloterrigena alkaliphila]|uniref:DUF3054 domain-containing protein n=1 Tax=Haloterrigena alkaliphila TaxID=2816475 RepID=A0A8A2VF26_9EURY|nr:DUF3054 domain-containing protein [Haloterrigena alkaliphila]QSW98915.1 DUF3054 domain-containing protein [Haloterrigena alkaliphila]